MTLSRNGEPRAGPGVRPDEDARAALNMIRDTIEQVAPGTLPPPEDTLLLGPRLVDEARVLCAAIRWLAPLRTSARRFPGE